MQAFRVLFVCIGNVCRSPLAERMLAARAPGLEVSSAGTWAMVGDPISPEAAVHLPEHGADGAGFVSRQLVPEMVAASDVVLTATKEVRSRVLEESPGALRRTFTILELAALVDLVEPSEDPAELVRSAAAHRSRVTLDSLDIPDPFRRGPEANAAAAATIAAAVDRIAGALAR